MAGPISVGPSALTASEIDPFREKKKLNSPSLLGLVSIRRSIWSASALAMPVLTVFHQFTRFEASSSKRVQLIPHSLSVLLTLFRCVVVAELWDTSCKATIKR